MVEYKTLIEKALLMRKNVEIVLNHSLLNVCNEFNLNITVRIINRKSKKSEISEKCRIF